MLRVVSDGCLPNCTYEQLPEMKVVSLVVISDYLLMESKVAVCRDKALS